ncbi:hypothetical protein [Streptomyces sp. NPDC051162]|uniref:hypothetical protein n=1 Tax=unclassified Streptomyces TaxID=2593676 RepID=UPI003438E4EE
MTEHLRGLVGDDHTRDVLDRARRQLDSPLAHFDAVVCLLADGSRETWEDARRVLDGLDTGWLAEWLAPAATGNDRETALRQIVTDAATRGLDRVLVLDAAALCAPGAAEHLRRAVDPLRTVSRRIRPLPVAAVAVRRGAFGPIGRGEPAALAAAAPWLGGCPAPG